MLNKDPLGGFIGSFRHGKDEIAYHVKGEGSPVLMTMGLSAAGGSYDWRYIFDCLAGAFKVYAVDVLGLESRRHGLPHGPSYYQKLVEAFLGKVIGERSSIISGPVEAPFALKASFERPGLIDKILIVSPDGARRIATHDTIGRSVLYRILRIPKVESVMYGSIASKRSMLVFLRKIRRSRAIKKVRPIGKGRMRQKYPPLPLLSERRFIESAWGTSLMQAPMRLSKMIRKSRRIVGEMDDFRILRNSRLIVFQRSGELPMRKDALRFCDDAIKFLG
jgi:pimeloyl-ACP methyl ester carboxylesterase